MRCSTCAKKGRPPHNRRSRGGLPKKGDGNRRRNRDRVRYPAPRVAAPFRSPGWPGDGGRQAIMAEQVRPQQERAAPEAAAPDGDQEAPPAPELSRGSWRTAAKRTLAEYREDNLQDRAAALTYFSVQSIFPGLLVLVTLLGLLGTSVTQNLIDQVTKAVPHSVNTIVSNALTRLQTNHSAAGILAVVGLALGLWSASAYVAAF